ncbi:hypothetical protein XENTR_v10021549 [Xenopus tropicalis]|uniref:Protein TMED8 isoform X1 n=2 Tax=Xenopus tropicalis TaxID=8364 RepID=F6XCI2_XENTR|nr:protein TMED8 isoform X1 [Xenopus tropicalis]XP_012823445.2 protein TMED8 isoform X1 [Xenopus tropicalis]KAE8586098.1 hypothetical protein XENTR_v10021549 [Xenopus tropicalis]
MSAAEDAASLPGEGSDTGDTESSQMVGVGDPETDLRQPEAEKTSGDNEGQHNEECKAEEEEVAALSLEETEKVEEITSVRSLPNSEEGSPDGSIQSSDMVLKQDVKKSTLEQELEIILSHCSLESKTDDVLMIQSEDSGKFDIVKVEKIQSNTEKGEKAPPPPLAPPSTWTSANLREFKNRMAKEKHGVLTVRRGEVLTVRVPTHPDGKRLCWEFATDDYDIGFGIYFDWTTVTSTAVTLQISESSDEEDEEEIESPWHGREGDVERGSMYRLRSRYGEIVQVYRRDSHREVQAGSHEYPGEGIYMLKLDNSYSLLRNKTLYLHVYYSS